MRPRNLIILATLILVIIFGASLLLGMKPPHAPEYRPATVSIAPAAAIVNEEATPMTFTLPEIQPTVPECGQPNSIILPESSTRVKYEMFDTTNGYIKVVATLTDIGETFTWPLTEGWKVSPIPPYRAEHLTQVTVTPCHEPAPEPPVTVPEPPVTETPAQPAPEPCHGCGCKKGGHHGADRHPHHR